MNRTRIPIALATLASASLAGWLLAEDVDDLKTVPEVTPSIAYPTVADKWNLVLKTPAPEADFQDELVLAQATPEPVPALAPLARLARIVPGTAASPALPETPEAPETPEPPQPPDPPEAPEPVTAFSFSGDPMDLALDASHFGLGNRSGGQPLIICSKASPENLVELREDLAVMGRLLTKAASGSTTPRSQAMGITLSAIGDLGSSSRPQPIYLDGFGAIFTLRVRFPLVEPPQKAPEKADKDENPTKEAWEEARAELYGGGKSGRNGVWVHSNSDANWTARTPEYSGERVEKLKKELIETLKHASNMRHLKPDDQIVVAVTGSAGAVNARALKVTAAGGGRPSAVTINRSGGGASDSAPDSTLTLRARKTDIDAFAKGKLSVEDFTKKAAVTTY